MRLLGRAKILSRSGNIVVEAREVPSIGAKVYDEKFSFVGYVYDIIGPISRPFVIVKVDLARWKPEAIVGKVLFWHGKPSRRKKRW